MLDGASNDEGWGRQTMLTTVPVGAVQEVAVLTNAFSAEFGWTAGPAMNIVTKSGTNALRGEGLYLARPGGLAGEDVLDRRLLPAVGADLHDAEHAVAINPADLPDELNQVSGSIGGPIVEGQDVLLRHRRLHARRTARRSSRTRCRRSCCRRTAASTTSATTGRRCSTAASITSSRRRRR